MLYNLEALQEFTGWDHESRIIIWLEENRIRWFKGKDGQPITTLTQIDASFGESTEVEFD